MEERNSTSGSCTKVICVIAFTYLSICCYTGRVACNAETDANDVCQLKVTKQNVSFKYEATNEPDRRKLGNTNYTSKKHAF